MNNRKSKLNRNNRNARPASHFRGIAVLALFFASVFLGLTARPGAAIPYATHVARLLWRNPAVAASSYQDVSSSLLVLKGTRLIFKAISDYPDKPWPPGSPTWGGSSGASGTGETTSVTFDTLSATTSDYKTVTATLDGAVTANVIVYDIIPSTKAKEDFPGRSEAHYGVGEGVDLTYTTQPAGIPVNLTWSIVNGNGSIMGVIWQAGDYATTTTLRAWVQSGSSADEYRDVSRGVVAPSSITMRHTPGRGKFHVRDTASTGFKGDPYLLPKDVSFSAIEVKEFSAVGRGDGYFECGTPTPEKPYLQPCPIHPEGAWQGVLSPNDPLVQPGMGSLVNGIDTIRTAINIRVPYSQGTFEWDIPWKYRLNGGTERLIENVKSREVIEASGKITKSKAGDLESSELLDPTSS